MTITRWIIVPDPCRTERGLAESVESGLFRDQAEAVIELDGFDPAQPHRVAKIEITLDPQGRP